jgi:hypothetical protein
MAEEAAGVRSHGSITETALRGARKLIEECRLLGYKTQCVPHRKHSTSPIDSPAG